MLLSAPLEADEWIGIVLHSSPHCTVPDFPSPSPHASASKAIDDAMSA